MGKVYLGLGTNLGEREENLRQAMELLEQGMILGQVSSVYETEPVGYKEQPLFLNLVCNGETELDPADFLDFAKGIEGKLGRKKSFRNAPRLIDIDILFYEDRVINAEDLIIPHPRICDRGFVLVPLAEIAPLFVHPVKNRTIRKLLSELIDSEQVRKWGNVPERQ